MLYIKNQNQSNVPVTSLEVVTRVRCSGLWAASLAMGEVDGADPRWWAGGGRLGATSPLGVTEMVLAGSLWSKNGD